MSDPSTAVGVAWDLTDLYAGPQDPQLARDLADAVTAARQFALRYRGRIGTPGALEAADLADAVAALEAILERVGKACAFADLLHAADTTPAAHGALVAHTQEQASVVRQEVLFFELEWLALDEPQARQLVDHPACAKYRHFLHALRRYRPHVLSEAEERILEDKANTGARAFARLFDEAASAWTFDVDVDGTPQRLNESGVLDLLYDARRHVRQAAAAALTRGLEANQLLLGFIFNTLVQDHAIDDRLRRYDDAMHSRHLANEISSDTVRALMEAVESRHDLVQRYYHLKGRLLGVVPLADYDRYAPVADDTTSIAWTDCRSIVLDAYRAFSPQMATVAADFFDRCWIDAEMRQGKRGGAFSASTVPSAHPYVLVNYTGKIHDVMTVAHELGHGVHQSLARPRGYLQADTPLTMAETASVFGEMLVFQHLRSAATSGPARLSLLCRKIEDTIATVFRQIALTRFEQHLHAARRSRGELSREAVCTLWMQANTALYGASVRLTDDYRWWWAYIPHFVHTPFYCYAYGFGELLVLALYEVYRREGASFVPRYLDLLAAGGSDTPERLLRRVGIDITNPSFWQLGLQPIADLVAEAEALAAP